MGKSFLNVYESLMLSYMIHQISDSSDHSLWPVFHIDDFCLCPYDCIDVMRNIPSDSIDMIFANPPYNFSNDDVTCYADKMVRTNKGAWDRSQGFDKDVAFHEGWISECKRILKPKGTIWINGTHHSIYQFSYIIQKL